MSSLFTLVGVILIPTLWVADQHVLVGAFASIGGVYLSALVADIRSARREIRTLAQARSTRRRAAISPVTSLGAAIISEAQAAAHRLENLEWEVVTTTKLRELPTGVVARENAESDYAPVGEPPFVSRVAQLAREYFKVKAVALLYQLHDGMGLASLGVQGRKFAAYVEYFIAQQRTSGLGAAPAFFDMNAQGSTLGNFRLFGIQSVICVQLTSQEENVPDSVLWLGYPEGVSVGERELLRVDEFCRRMRKEIQIHSQFEDLERKAESAAEGRHAQSEFMAQVSHDIRSPLNNVKAILAVLEGSTPLEKDRDLLDVARDNCDTVAELVEGILDYTKCNTTTIEPHPTVVVARELVRQVIAEFSVTARLKSLSLEVDDRAPGALLNIDRHHAKRVMSNLVSNAIKYTDRGGVVVRIVARDSDDAVGIEVVDSGRGMTSEQVNRLFTPFTRFHGHDTQGVGLGLVVCKKLIEANYGALTINSTEGVGSTACLVVPSARKALDSSLHIDAAPRKVLVVDDDSDYCRTLVRAMGGTEFQVITASTIEEGIGLAVAQSPDFIVSDGRIGERSVREFVSLLRERAIFVPIVLASGAEISQHDPIRQELSAVLSKPLDIPMLCQILRQERAPVRQVA